MKEQFKEFSFFFGLQTCLYTLFCFSTRAITSAHYLSAMAIIAINSTIVFWGIRETVKTNSSLASWAGYTTGSVFGVGCGIWFSTML